MIQSLCDLLFPGTTSGYLDAVMAWIEQVLADSRYLSVDATTGEIINHSITSLDLGFALIPWDSILSCVVLCVFIVCLFKFMRSVFCKQI